MSDEQEKDQENFLTRWSRRKVRARRVDPGERPGGPPGSALPHVQPESGERAAMAQAPAHVRTHAPTHALGDAPTQAPAPLPTIEELRGLQSEYRDFLRPGVDEPLRRAALKKLFQDPHFNIMDGLDTYIDDYSKEDPIPTAMLKALNQAKGLIFDSAHEERGASESRATPTPAAGEPAQAPALDSPPVSSAPVSSTPVSSNPMSTEADKAGERDVTKSDASRPGTLA